MTEMKKYRVNKRLVGPEVKLNMDGYFLEIKPTNFIGKLLWRFIKVTWKFKWEPMGEIHKLFYWEMYCAKEDLINTIDADLCKEVN